MAQGISVAAPPTTPAVATEILTSMAAQSGVITDYNVGSQIRTFAEAIGAVAEITGVSALVIALQVIAYGGMSLFGISPNQATPAFGSVTFSTAAANAPPALNNIPIPIGTLVGTLGGVQFQTTSAVTLVQGATGISAPIIGLIGGANTNVPAGVINQLLTGLVYPVSVTNAAPTSGGADAETPSQALTRLAAALVSLVGGSPVSVASSAIGVQASGSSETVMYSTCYEGWADPTSANFPNTAGFQVYIDNGFGTASQALLNAVTTKLNGNFVTSTKGFRPSGVPFTVLPVVPISANVAVSATVFSVADIPTVTSNMAAAASGYFTLAFGTQAQLPLLSAALGNAALGRISSLTVNLYYNSAPASAVTVVSGALFTRVILNSMTLNVSGS